MSDPSRLCSPKSSPRGSRSPAYPRQDSTGTLKTTITLGKNPSIVHSGPFYLMKEPPVPDQGDLTGSTNLMTHYCLEHAYNKISGKKLKEELSAFLPNLPGNIDTPGLLDNSSLRSLIEKPPITGKELVPLSGASLAGFRLHPGPLPEQYRLMSQLPQKKKHKKHKREGRDNPLHETQESGADASMEHKKTKRTKKSDEERKKRKKEKKKKREKEREEKAPSS